jgi:hypothetical protein
MEQIMIEISKESFEELKGTQVKKLEGMISYMVPCFTTVVEEGKEETIYSGDIEIAKMLNGVCYTTEDE